MVQYDNILFLLSIFLILIILFLVLFGCRRTRIINANYERFTNINDNDEKEELTEITETKTKTENKKTKNEEVEKLSTFEKSILDGLSSGSLTTDNLSTLIKEEKFTENNLENLINYVEHFKGNIPSS